MRVTLLITCVVDVLAPDVGDATVEVLQAAGCDVSCDLSQTCCGQPAWNAGFADEAAKVARPTLAALERELDAGAELVVAPAGSCATMVRRFWPEMFEVAGDPDAAERARRVGERTREVSEMVAPHVDRLDDLALDAPLRVALHESCHLLRELRVVEEPRRLLDAVAGCERVAWEGADRCCGFGGTFSVKLPETSVAMADEKLAALEQAAPDVVVGCDTSCLLHLQARAEEVGTPLRVRHVVEVLAEALRGDRTPAGTSDGDSA